MLEHLAPRFLWPKVRPKRKNNSGNSKLNIIGLGLASSLGLTLLGMFSSAGATGVMGILGIFNGTAHAATLQPTATLTINNGGTTEFSTTLDTKNGTTSALIAVPVKVEVEQTDKYSMGIYLDCTNAPSECNTGNLGALTDSNLVSVGSGSGSSTTTRIESTTANIQFGNIATNHWGFWYLNNTTTPTVEGSTGTYVSPVPTTTTGTNTIPETAISNAIPETSAGSTGTTTVNGQLVFGTKADSTLASGSYSGKVVVTLTATPQEVAESAFASITTMQEMNPAVCNSASIGDVTNLKDTRDNQYYVVGKLADGRCWMLQNLALQGGKTIYPNDSNITASSYTLPATTPLGTGSAVNGRWGSDTDATGWMYDGKHINTGSLEAGYIAGVIDEAPTSNTAPTVSTGAYYSYAVATAGTGVNTGQGQNYQITSSICPKNWHLPTGGYQETNGNGEFQKLYEAYSRNESTFRTAFRYAATGHCDTTTCPFANGLASYWSSTLNSGVYGYRLFATDGVVDPANSDPMGFGDSVRCVANNTMQSMTAEACSALEYGDTLNLMDARDAKYYVVGKLADGNCWMLQNLALEGGKTIYSNDSNITASSYTLPATTPVVTSNYSPYWKDDTDTTGWIYNGNHINTGSLEVSYLSSIIDEAPTKNTAPTVSTGAYYSYIVATAGTGTSTTKYDRAPSSICPKNWHLPTSGDVKTNGNGEFQTLYDAYNSDSRGQVAGFKADFRYATTGSCINNSCPSVDDGASYWSSTIYGPFGGGYDGYYLRVNGNNVIPTGVKHKRDGSSVRCMLTAAS